MAEEAGVSFNPNTAVASGTFLDDVDVVMETVRATLFDYNGTVNPPVPTMVVSFKTDDGSQSIQHYTTGDAKHFMPRADGKGLVPMGAKKALPTKCNAILFLTHLINAGFPADKIGGDLSVMDGTRIHVTQVPGTGPGAKPIVVPAKVLSLPGEAPTKASPVAPVSATASTPASSNGDLTSDASAGVLAILMNAPAQSIDKKALVQEMFKAHMSHPNRNALVALVTNEQFLSAGPWKYSGSTLSLA